MWFFFFPFFFPHVFPNPSLPDTVHIEECPCNWASHTACNRGVVPCQPCLVQIPQLFNASPFIDSQVCTYPCLLLLSRWNKRRNREKESPWATWVCTFSYHLSDTRNGHGAWNILIASSLNRRAWCHHPWGPVNAAVLRAWRHGPGALHTVVTLSAVGRAYSTGTPLTRWETLRTATGGEQACMAYVAPGLSRTFWEVSSLCWFSLSLERPVRALWETQWKLTHNRHDDEIR